METIKLIIKRRIAKIIICNREEYCLYCLLSILNYNIHGFTYESAFKIMHEHLNFTPIEFDDAWSTAKFYKYIIKIEDTKKYIIGMNIFEYEYNILLQE